jgi:hypothetical protein
MRGAKTDSIEVGKTTFYNDQGIQALLPGDTLSVRGTFYESFPGGTNVNKSGTYNIVYSVTDPCGNFDSVVRTVKATDHTPPVISLKGPNLSSVCQWSVYQDSGYIVSDNNNKKEEIKIDTFGNILTKGTGTPGNYFLKYKATDKSGNATYSESRNVFVIPRGQGNCLSGFSDIADMEKYISIYPNPDNGQFTISSQCPIETDIKINISNTLGKEIFTSENKALKQNPISIDLSHEADGIYYINLTSNSGNMTKKILVRH